MRGGLRYTNDEKDFNTVSAVNVVQIGPSSVNESKHKVNWDLSGTYKLNKDVNVYARVATGFRAPSIAAASAAVPITVADAETILSYEAGIKADLFNRRGRVAFSVYDFDVKNQQLTVVGGNSNVNRLINAAKTKGRGAELDFEGFVTSDFKVTAGGSYNFTEIRDRQPVGQQVRQLHRDRSDQRRRPRRHRRQPVAAGAALDRQRHARATSGSWPMASCTC